MRWLVLIVMLFDILSTPFHHHRHDNDVDADFGAGAHELLAHDDSVSHVEDVDHDAHAAGHSAMALRTQLESTVHGSTTAADALTLATAFVLVFPTIEVDSPVPDWPDRGPPQFTSFKSLPPAGRAPPLHA